MNMEMYYTEGSCCTAAAVADAQAEAVRPAGGSKGVPKLSIKHINVEAAAVHGEAFKPVG
jgi:hypothetical protein